MPRRFVESPDSGKPLTPEQQKMVDDAVAEVRRQEAMTTCALCGDEILPFEKVVYGNPKTVQFHDDCYLAEKGVPEGLIDQVQIIQNGEDGEVNAIIRADQPQPSSNGRRKK